MLRESFNKPKALNETLLTFYYKKTKGLDNKPSSEPDIIAILMNFPLFFSIHTELNSSSTSVGDIWHPE